MDMSAFKPMSLASIYRDADASAAQAMQTNLMTMQAGRMQKEYQEEDALAKLARESTIVGEDGTPKFDLKSFSRNAYSINPQKALGFEKAGREAEKAGVDLKNAMEDAEQKRLKGAAERLKYMHEASSVPFLKWQELTDAGMPDAEARKRVQPLYVGAIRNLVTSGLFKPEELQKYDMPDEFDPATTEAGMRYVLGAKEALGQFWKKKEFGLDKDKFGESLRKNAVDEDLAQKKFAEDLRSNRVKEGQGAASVRQGWERLNIERERMGQDKLGAPQEIMVDGKPTMASFDKTNRTYIDVNTGRPVGGQVTPKDAGGTEGERLAAGYANRMVKAEKIMAGLSSGNQEKGFWEGAIGAVPLVGEGAANQFTRNESRQKALQAQQDWVRAKLRKESGAVIGEAEMQKEIETYFPQFGDSPGTINQKREARKTAAEGMVQTAGRSYTGEKPTSASDAGKIKTSAISVAAPDGQTYTFPTKEAADKFKKAAGIQ